jgi:transposase
MKVKLHAPSDLDRLREFVRDERDAKQRDRYRVALVAAEGVDGEEVYRERIAAVVGRSRQFVDQWARRYRTGGIDALRPKKQPGRASRLSAEEKEGLQRAIDAGPREGVDGRSVFFGEDIRGLNEREFGKVYSLSGVYKLLDRLDYGWLCPRPRNPRGDLVAQEAFKKSRR